MRTLFKIAVFGFALVGFVTTVAALAFFYFPFSHGIGFTTDDVLAKWKQPASVAYDGHGPYYLLVKREGRETTHTIYVGRDGERASYGHMISFTFHPQSDEKLRDFLAKSVVEWVPEGVRLSVPSGHVIFVPQKMFTGGR